jgi:hypothetical protein
MQMALLTPFRWPKGSVHLHNWREQKWAVAFKD